ncbi:MAG: Rieske 2Fe-2S domain-containing protein [Planctomycetia bacterium]|nr:Rieske 2Fe-2S domain-containing protein [Planctomycetia bacterium]
MSTHLQEQLRRFDPTLPLERARTIPAAWYLDPEIHEAERSAVFGNTWHFAGRLDQLTAPGAFVTLDIAGEPVLVVRDAAGVLRAFSNVCRHRAAVVMNEPCGMASKLRCRYHGWTYDLAGQLRGTPEFEGVGEFARDEHGLPELAVSTWGPLVWVHLGRPAMPLAEFLAPLPERLMDLNKLRFVERRAYEVACNWKVFVDNFLDGGYHVNTVHPGLSGALDYSRYRTETFDQCSVQVAPLKASDDPAIAQSRAGDCAYYWWVYPNLMLNLYRGVMDVNVVLPLGPSRCQVLFDFYFEQTEGDGARQFIAESIRIAEQIQQEDMDISVEVQRGLASRSYDTGRFSVRREAGGYHFHRLLARQLQAR